MTYNLETLSEGRIDTGFWGPAPKFLQFGDFLFTTEGYCEMLRHIAEEPSRTTSSIFTYPSEILKSAVHAYAQQFFPLARKAGKNSKRLEKLIAAAHLYKVTPDEEKELSKMRKLLFVNLYHRAEELSPISKAIVNKYGTDKIISIDKYVLSYDIFSNFTDYVINGGFLGWPNNSVPPFAEKTKQDILSSEHPLYSQLKNRFQPKEREMN
jgi:hypothetical protein